MVLLLLTEYKASKLGLSIQPAEVRLITGPDDAYAWQTLPEKRHLFCKQLSKHSIGAYRELCRGVGVWFEAVATTASRANAGELHDQERIDLRCSADSEIKFAARIDQLQSEIRRLTAELDVANGQVAEESKLKEIAVVEGTRLQESLRKAATDEQVLRQHIQKLQGKFDCFKRTISRSVDDCLSGSPLDFTFQDGGRIEQLKSPALWPTVTSHESIRSSY